MWSVRSAEGSAQRPWVSPFLFESTAVTRVFCLIRSFPSPSPSLRLSGRPPNRPPPYLAERSPPGPSDPIPALTLPPPLTGSSEGTNYPPEGTARMQVGGRTPNPSLWPLCAEQAARPHSCSPLPGVTALPGRLPPPEGGGARAGESRGWGLGRRGLGGVPTLSWDLETLPLWSRSSAVKACQMALSSSSFKPPMAAAWLS